MANALYFLRVGGPGVDRPIHDASRRLRHQTNIQMKLALKILPWFVLAFFAADIVAVLIPKKDRDMHVREFGRLPVLLNGRIQPFDSVGHNSLLQIRSMAELPLEEIPSWQFWRHGKKLRATEWLLEVMF